MAVDELSSEIEWRRMHTAVYLHLSEHDGISMNPFRSLPHMCGLFPLGKRLTRFDMKKKKQRGTKKLCGEKIISILDLLFDVFNLPEAGKVASNSSD